jgi:NUDIX domain
MNFEPQKFFIGLMDFFSIVLPGALLTFLLMPKVGPAVLGQEYSALVDTKGWTAFLFTSYLVGHLVFLLGSWLDEFYDWARGHTLNAQIKRLASRGQVLSWPMRSLVWLSFKGESNLAVERAGRIKRQVLEPLQAHNAINTFQWCKAFLNVESPASLAIVQRFEADSKFFRCFAVVLLLLLAVWPLQDEWPPVGIAVVLVLLLLSLSRYVEQRFKSTNQAYWSVIALIAQAAKIHLDPTPRAPGGTTHAGGVVFRIRAGQPQYLLVEAKDDPDHWVLPKGHVEEAEDSRETAVREVHEETGVWAGIGVIRPTPQATSAMARQEAHLRRRLAADLGTVSYSVSGAAISVKFYLMEALARGRRLDKNRQHVWLPLALAVTCASHNETRELLQTAEQRRVRS